MAFIALNVEDALWYGIAKHATVNMPSPASLPRIFLTIRNDQPKPPTNVAVEILS